MIGYFTGSDAVGLYNCALTPAELIPIALTSMNFIYIPIITQLYSKSLSKEINRSYQVLTKWIFSISLPLFMVFFIFPESILSLFFGEQYVPAAIALQILSVGFLFHTFLGANGQTLLVIGKTRLMMWITLMATVLNIILNIFFIPKWGICGAAFASLISYFVINTLYSIKLYQTHSIPFC